MAVIGRPRSRQPAIPPGVKLDGRHRPFGFFRRVDLGNDDALGPAIHKSQNDRWGIGGHPHDGGDAVQLGSPHHLFTGARVQPAVLAFQHDKVPFKVANISTRAGSGSARSSRIPILLF